MASKIALVLAEISRKVVHVKIHTSSFLLHITIYQFQNGNDKVQIAIIKFKTGLINFDMGLIHFEMGLITFETGSINFEMRLINFKMRLINFKFAIEVIDKHCGCSQFEII